LIGKIVECEAYPGGDDKASHSYNGKMTERTRAMYMKPGTVYIYNIYGLYCCLNVSSSESGGAVLIRALEPVSGIELMRTYRAESNNKTKKAQTKSLKIFKDKNIASGPAKLCMAMMINKVEFNEVDISECNKLWIQNDLLDKSKESNLISTENIVETKRVGIDYAGELAVNSLFRFYLKNSSSVSVVAK